VVRVSPPAHGLQSLGHLNWFRPSHEAVWPVIAQAVQHRRAGAAVDATAGRHDAGQGDVAGSPQVNRAG